MPQGHQGGRRHWADDAGQGHVPRAQKRAACLGVSFDQKVTSAPGLVLGPPTTASWSRPETFAATRTIVGGNRKTITATNLYIKLF